MARNLPNDSGVRIAERSGRRQMFMRGAVAALWLAVICAAAGGGEAVYEGKTATEWARELWSSDYETRRRAGYALRKLGPRAADAIPLVAQLLRHRNQRMRTSASNALANIGPAAIPAILEALKEKRSGVREAAIRALPSKGEGASAAVPILLRVVQDPDEHEDVVAFAATRLGSHGTGARAAIPTFTKLLRDERGDVIRRAAAQGLGNMGREARVAVPTLIEMLRDVNEGVRVSAAQALGWIGADSSSAVPALRELLRDENHGVRASAARALGRIGPAAASAVEAIAGLLKDKRRTVSFSAAEALVDLGPVAKDAVPALTEALGHEFGETRYKALLALREIGSGARPAAPALAKLLGNPRMRDGAGAALASIGPGAVPALQLALFHTDRETRKAAIVALIRIGKEASAAVPALEAMLIVDEKDAEMVKYAEYALLKIRGTRSD